VDPLTRPGSLEERIFACQESSPVSSVGVPVACTRAITMYSEEELIGLDCPKTLSSVSFFSELQCIVGSRKIWVTSWPNGF
jgi:hypothetical protein